MNRLSVGSVADEGVGANVSKLRARSKDIHHYLACRPKAYVIITYGPNG